ncbi:MAG: APC family permease [Haloplanus sp.]
MSSVRPLRGRHVVAVSLGLPLGAGVFYLPRGVENLAGPVTPVAYLLGAFALCPLAAAYAVFLSSPLAERDGLVYAAVSRTWGSRRLGFLSTWPAVGAYVALLALHVAALGRTLSTFVGVAPDSATATAATLVVLGVVVAVHALGPSVAGRVQLGVVGLLTATLVGMGIAGLTKFVPWNFAPLLPTPTLRQRPLATLGAAATAALFGFVGFDAGAAASAATRDPRRTAPRAVFVGLLVAGAVATLAALITLGVIPWSRLLYAPAPFANAAASGLPVGAEAILVPGVALATAGAAFATVWLPARTIRGVADVVPGADRTTRPGVPDPALAVTGLLAAGVVAFDLVGYALYLALAGIVLQYGALAASALALPLVRPALYRRCSFRLPPAVLGTVGGLAVAVVAVALGRVFALDPVTSLGFSRWAPLLPAVGDVLVRDPLSTVVPALLLWELVGVAVLAVAADYRADRGIEPPPLAAAYKE